MNEQELVIGPEVKTLLGISIPNYNFLRQQAMMAQALGALQPVKQICAQTPPAVGSRRDTPDGSSVSAVLSPPPFK